MEAPTQKAKVVKRSQQDVSSHQGFLFVDASAANTSRRNARSFVMQRARKERPWSTSKHAAKQQARGSSSPQSLGTPTPASTPNTTSLSPIVESIRNGYFPAFKETTAGALEAVKCENCGIHVVRFNQKICSKCNASTLTVSARELNSGAFDPFGSSCVEITEHVSELLDHCKSEHLLYQLLHHSQIGQIATRLLRLTRSKQPLSTLNLTHRQTGQLQHVAVLETSTSPSLYTNKKAFITCPCSVFVLCQVAV